MNKTIVVGHPDSRYLEAVLLLREYGMQSPVSSHQDGKDLDEIIATLSKAHNVPALQDISADNPINQISPNPLWNGVSLDFFLSNLETPPWVWGASSALFFMQYLSSLDHEIRFILIYCTPQNAIIHANQGNRDTFQCQDPNAAISNWKAYHEELIRFCHQYKDKCLLVSDQEILGSRNSFIQLVSSRFDIPIFRRLTPTFEVATGNLLSTHTSDMGAHSQDNDVESTIDAAYRYVVNDLLRDDPVALNCYEELQCLADVPSQDHPKEEVSTTTALLSITAQKKHLAEIQKQLREHQNHTSRLHKEHQRLQSELSSSQAHANQLSSELRQVQTAFNTEIEQRRQESASYLEKIRATEVEKEAIQNQLFIVQEQLEKQHKRNQKPVVAYYGAAERVKRHLSYQLGAEMIENSRHLFGWFYMPLALLRVTLKFRKEKAIHGAKKLPPVRLYKDAQEAERVKLHLSYQLGRTFLVCIRSPLGWLRLPFALSREVRAFRAIKQTNMASN